MHAKLNMTKLMREKVSAEAGGKAMDDVHSYMTVMAFSYLVYKDSSYERSAFDGKFQELRAIQLIQLSLEFQLLSNFCHFSFNFT